MFDIDIKEVSQFALLAGQLSLVLVLLLALQVAALRFRLILRNRRKAAIVKRWRPQISNAIYGGRVKVYKIADRDLYYLLEEIDYVFSVIKGKELAGVIKLCDKLQLHDRLLKLLKSRDLKKKLYALITLGNLQDEKAWDVIEEHLMHTQTTLSITAARSMMKIDPLRAIKIILPVSLARADWPWANLGQILKLAAPEQICQPLAEMIQTLPTERQSGYLRLFELNRCEEISPVTNIVLTDTESAKVASVCLHITQDPRVIETAVKYTEHNRWHVRMHAATALGRLGGEKEIPVLTGLLTDSEWWVRYRAAQSLTNLPVMTRDKLMTIYEDLQDRFAKDMLLQVLSEKQHAG